MKVKIGDKIYDGNEVPIMLILNDEEKKLIANMSPTLTKFAVYQREHFSDVAAVQKWMAEG